MEFVAKAFGQMGLWGETIKLSINNLICSSCKHTAVARLVDLDFQKWIKVDLEIDVDFCVLLRFCRNVLLGEWGGVDCYVPTRQT